MVAKDEEMVFLQFNNYHRDSSFSAILCAMPFIQLEVLILLATGI